MAHLYSDSALLSQYALRTVDQFEDRREILSALRDAVIENRDEWLTTQKAHGNIDFSAILINESGQHGYLVKPHSPSDSKFASARSLDRNRRRRLFSRHYDCCFDYVDDLESFYHVLGWISCVFEGPHQYQVELPGLLQLLSKPTIVTRIALKRELILHGGYESCPMTRYFSEDVSVFPQLLQRMQAVVRRGYERNEHQERRLRPLQKRAQAELDYNMFIEAIDDALYLYDSAESVGTSRYSEKEEQRCEDSEGWSTTEFEQAIGEWISVPSGEGFTEEPSSPDTCDSSESSGPLTPADSESQVVPISKASDLPHPSLFGTTEYPLSSLQFSVDHDSGLQYTYLPNPDMFQFVFDI